MTVSMTSKATISDLAGLRLLVVGLGKTGCSVCRFLHEQRLAFDAVDNRDNPPLLIEAKRWIGDGRVYQSFSAELFSQYDVLIVSPGIAISTPSIQSAIDSGVEVIGDVELFARAVAAPVIAVTGSNGKSTVVAWLDSVLKETSLHAVLCGNIGEPVLSSLDDSADVYIVELSSFQLETTFSLKPLSATVLNVSEDHMDRYDNLEHYAAVKRKIYRYSENLVINAEDAHTWPLEDPGALTGVIRFGAERPVGSGLGLRQHEGASWLATVDSIIIAEQDLPLPGLHNVLNALAVIALLRPLGLTQQEITNGLKAFTGLPHRTQLVREIAGVRWYNDSKGTNVDACEKAIGAMAGPVILIMGGQGKDADFSSLRGIVKQHVKTLILMGQDAAIIAAALRDIVEPLDATDMSDAVTQAARRAEPGDVVLLSPACASFDMFDSFEHRGDAFIQAVQQVAA